MQHKATNGSRYQQQNHGQFATQRIDYETQQEIAQRIGKAENNGICVTFGIDGVIANLKLYFVIFIVFFLFIYKYTLPF